MTNDFGYMAASDWFNKHAEDEGLWACDHLFSLPAYTNTIQTFVSFNYFYP